jgi:hypothetical protein
MARSKSKYAHLTDKLRRLPGVTGEANADPRYQDRVEECKRGILAPPQPGESPVVGQRESLVAARHEIDEADRQLRHAQQDLLRACAGKRHAIELGHAYAGARDMVDVLKARLSEANLLVESYAQLLSEQAEVEDSHGMDIGGRALSMWDEPYSKVVDKDGVREFFYRDPLLRPSLAPAWSTVDSLNRMRMLLGGETIPGTEVWAKRKIRLGSE